MQGLVNLTTAFADGIAVLLSRVPTGWLADRIRSLHLMLGGLVLNGT